MPYRLMLLTGLLAAVIAAPVLAESQASKAVPRTSDGHPDLQGVWTNATITPLERPAEFATKATATDAEARAY